MKLTKIAVFVTGFTFIAPMAWSHSRGADDATEGLISLMGTYRLVKHVYGECDSRMVVGMGRNARSFRAGPYEFIGVGLGKQRVYDGEWDGWVETEVGPGEIETKTERRSLRDGTKVKEEVEAELEDGLVQIEYKRYVRSHRNKEKVRNKCFYEKVEDGGRLPDDGSIPDQGKGGQDDGQQDGDQGKGPIGK